MRFICCVNYLAHSISRMEPLSREYELKLKKAQELLVKIVKVGETALPKFKEDHYDLEVFAFINYLERFTYNLKSINILLGHYKDVPHVETSIGLIMRASLLDYMTTAYLSTYMADAKPDDAPSQEKFKKEFDSMIADQVRHTISYAKLALSIGHIKKPDYKKVIEGLFHSYHFVFADTAIEYDTPEKKLISSHTISPTALYKRIHSHPLTNKYAGVYDLYIYYSKYEHFGIMTHFLQRRGEDLNLDTILAGIKYMIRGMGGSFVFLSYPKDLLEMESEALHLLQDDFDTL